MHIILVVMSKKISDMYRFSIRSSRSVELAQFSPCKGSGSARPLESNLIGALPPTSGFCLGKSVKDTNVRFCLGKSVKDTNADNTTKAIRYTVDILASLNYIFKE